MILTTPNSATFQVIENKELLNHKNTVYGPLFAFGIISLWAVSLSIFLATNLAKFPVYFILPAMLWQMFLYTGLFITAHDAMHGAVCPQSVRINRFIGSLAVIIYGLFSYKELLQKHWLHHHHPASDRDPDFHDGKHTNFIGWYLYFMRRYGSWKQFIGLTVIYQSAHLIFHIPQLNLILFWIVPSILSSIQLFYFGTFLTHKEPVEGFKNHHRAQTNPLPVLWSLITCYHFGYHEEHHAYPQLAWWQLPAIHKKLNSTCERV
ncbi:MAG: fatty acid desaturase [Cyanosarcina radialis HA8281-LM2]|jgi:beta-carotene ketolase (CrtW type)|nr:fatty acid desaturase [Cyanosarcina radialis HA8281-LM2]